MALVRLLFSLMVIAIIAACGGDGVSTGTPCQDDSDCGGGRCLHGREATGICSNECDSASDCPADLGCSFDPTDGNTWCAGCDRLPLAVGSVCIDDVQVACAYAGDAWNCGDCGCPDDGFCDGGSPQCQSARQVGEPCEEHDECLSDNCSATRTASGVCQAAAGAACTDDTCESCDRTPAGPICARKCNTGGCPQGSACVGSREQDRYYCRADCSAECPYGWTCETLEIFSVNRTLCFPTSECSAPGQACGDGTCAALPGAGYNICAPSCSAFRTYCPGNWSCTQIQAGTYACLPPSP